MNGTIKIGTNICIRFLKLMEVIRNAESIRKWFFSEILTVLQFGIKVITGFLHTATYTNIMSALLGTMLRKVQYFFDILKIIYEQKKITSVRKPCSGYHHIAWFRCGSVHPPNVIYCSAALTFFRSDTPCAILSDSYSFSIQIIFQEPNRSLVFFLLSFL